MLCEAEYVKFRCCMPLVFLIEKMFLKEVCFCIPRILIGWQGLFQPKFVKWGDCWIFGVGCILVKQYVKHDVVCNVTTS